MSDSPRKRFGLSHALALNASGSILAFLILAATGDDNSVNALLRAFLYSVVYANCIGSLMCWLLPAHAQWGLRFPWDWLTRIGAILVCAATGSAIANLLFVLGGLHPWSEYWDLFGSGVRLSIVVGLVFGISVSLYEMARSRAEDAARLATEARLFALESRVHPHFLFNTLNSISQLIHEDPAKADAMVGRLAGLLRSSLDSKALVPLGQELTLVRDYLEIEKARFGNRLRFSIEAAGGLEMTLVPPLAMQSLVENSVKHVVSTRREGGEVRVAARREGNRVLLEVRDDGPGFSLESAPVGHGLHNLTARLEALFGSRAQLEVGQSSVRLTVPAASS